MSNIVTISWQHKWWCLVDMITARSVFHSRIWRGRFPNFLKQKKWRLFHQKWWFSRWITQNGENIVERIGDIFGDCWKSLNSCHNYCHFFWWQFFHQKWWLSKWITVKGEKSGERTGDIFSDCWKMWNSCHNYCHYFWWKYCHQIRWRFFHQKWWLSEWITVKGEKSGERKGDVLGEC